MLKAVEKLINNEARVVGNHSREDWLKTIKFYYHSTAIATVDTLNRTITIDDGGWGTSSTTRAINSYLSHYEPIGYEVIDLRRK